MVDAEASCPLSPRHDVVDFLSATVAAEVADAFMLAQCAFALLGVQVVGARASPVFPGHGVTALMVVVAMERWVVTGCARCWRAS